MMSTLLVVDDESSILASLRDCLSSPGLEVITARTAREGIELIQKVKPDVALFDVRLPDMSGLEAYDRIRKFDPRIPIIIMTAYARMETAIEAMRRARLTISSSRWTCSGFKMPWPRQFMPDA